MKKTKPYKRKICLLSNGMVKVALCTSTAGLAGSCNHVAALLYALEEFVRFGLREEVDSPTSRLCKWNRPRGKKVQPKKVVDVRLHRASFGNVVNLSCKRETDNLTHNSILQSCTSYLLC